MSFLASCLVSIVTCILMFFLKKYTYWMRKNVKGPLPIPIFGNYYKHFTMQESAGVSLTKIYNKYSDKPYVGIYLGTEPVLLLRDPELIKIVLIRDFHKFHARFPVSQEFRDPLISGNLFTCSGDNWKALRQIFNPLFATGKLKHFFNFMTEAGDGLDHYLDLQYKKSDIVDVKDISVRFILDVVGLVFFGLHFDTLKEGENEIKKFGNTVDDITDSVFIKQTIRDVWPTIYYMFAKTTHRLRENGFDRTYYHLAKSSFESRNYKPSGRNDAIDFLLNLKEQGSVEMQGLRSPNGQSKMVKIEATETMLVSQVLVFFFAGFSTSSTYMSLMLYELARHPHYQERLVDEIEKVIKTHNGEFTYETIQEMKFLGMILSEIQRLYPLAGSISRESTEDYTFEDYNFSIKKGTRVFIPMYSIHHDPKYYPDPHKFNPDRFSPEEVAKRPSFTYFPFGEGQRYCIAMRYAQIQIMLGVAKFVHKYHLEFCDKTPPNIVEKFDKRTLSVAYKCPNPIRIAPRKK